MSFVSSDITYLQFVRCAKLDSLGGYSIWIISQNNVCEFN